MALRTKDEIINEVLVSNNRTTTDAFITDTILSDWFVQSHNWAAGFKPWPMTEGAPQTTFATEKTPVFEGLVPDSTRFIQIAGERYQKMTFDEYQKFREEVPSDEKRIFSDFGLTYYINPNGASGTLIAYAHFLPAIDETDEDFKTIFSGTLDDGNDAIVEYMSSLLKRREHLPDEANNHIQLAVAKLREVWARIADAQVDYHTQEGMFKRMDVLNGGFKEDLFKRDQFS